MTSPNILSLFLAVIVAVSCLAPSSAIAYDQRTKDIAQDIYDIANYGEKRSHNKKGFLDTLGEMAIFVGIIAFLIVVWAGIFLLKEKVGKNKTIILISFTVITLVVITSLWVNKKHEEKDKELACRKQAIQARDRGETTFKEYLMECYEPSVFNPNAYYGIE